MIDEVKPDVIMTHNLRGMGMGVARAVRQSGIRWMHTLHDIQLLVPSGRYWFDRTPLWQRPMVTTPYRWWVRWLMGSPNVVVGPTRYIVDAHRRAGLFQTSTTQVIHNPVTDVPGQRRSFIGVHDPLRLAFVGQLTVHKGVHVLLEALGKIEGRVQVDLYGDGSQGAELMARANLLPQTISVRLRGKVPHAQLLNKLVGCDALMFPSTVVENCPGAVLEAVALGLPVIASAVGGVPELIDPSGLVPPADPDALVEKIKALRNGKVRAVELNAQTTIESYIERLIELSQ